MEECSANFVSTISTVASTIFAAVAAMAAAYSAYQAYREWRRAQDNRKLETQSRYYRVAVADPSIEAVEYFRVKAREVFEDKIATIQDLHDSNVSIEKVKSEKEKLADQYQTHFVRMEDAVKSAVSGWDETLYDDAESILDDVLEDVLNSTLPKIVEDPYADIAWKARLNETTGKIIRFLRDKDPILKDFDQ